MCFLLDVKKTRFVPSSSVSNYVHMPNVFILFFGKGGYDVIRMKIRISMGLLKLPHRFLSV
jgi:hypothetical protein